MHPKDSQLTGHTAFGSSTYFQSISFRVACIASGNEKRVLTFMDVRDKLSVLGTSHTFRDANYRTVLLLRFLGQNSAQRGENATTTNTEYTDPQKNVKRSQKEKEKQKTEFRTANGFM